MAYLQQPSSYFDQASEASSADLFMAGGKPALFTALELTVLRMSRSESIATVTEPGLIRRLAGKIFALPPANRLADERLEGLRRFAILARCGGKRAASSLPAFLALGFNRLQASALTEGAYA
jgi:hypothetical protein